MRPLKPYTLALGGFIAALFSVFLGAPAGAREILPVAGPTPDLQPKRAASASELVASRDAKSLPKSAAPQPQFSPHDFPRYDDFCPALPFIAQSRLDARERLVDQRELLLVGVIELRI